MARTSNELQFGDYVLLNDDREGYIRYIGERAHHRGVWYGIELIIGVGSNNGTERGEIYFVCNPGRGIFARSWNIKRVLSNHRKSHHGKRKKSKKHRRKPPKSPSKSPRMNPKSPSRSPRMHSMHKSPGMHPKHPSKSPRMKAKSPRMNHKSPAKSPRMKPSKRNNHEGSRSKSYANVEQQRYHKQPPHSVRSAMTKALKSRNKPPKNKRKGRHGSAQITVSSPKQKQMRHSDQRQRDKYDTNNKQHIVSRSVGLSVTDDINPVFDLAAILDTNNDSEPLYHNDAYRKKAQKVIKKRKSKKFKPLPAKRRSKKHKKRRHFETDSDSSSDSTPPLPRRKKSKSRSRRDNSLSPNPPSPRTSSSKSRSRGRKRKPVSNRKYSDPNSPPFAPQKKRKSVNGNNYPQLARDLRSPDSPVRFSQVMGSKKRKTVSNRPRFASPQPILKKKRNSAYVMHGAPSQPKRKSFAGFPRPPPPPPKRKKSASKPLHRRFASPQPIKKKKRKSSKSNTKSMTPTAPQLITGLRSATLHKSPSLPPQISITSSLSYNKNDRINSPAHKYKKRDLTTNLEQLEAKNTRRTRAWSEDSLNYAPPTKQRDGWNCAQCSRFNKTDFRFCPNCGGKRPLEAAKLPDIELNANELKQASDSEERSDSEDDDHSQSIRNLLNEEAPKKTSIEILNDITAKPKSPSRRHQRAQSAKKSVLDRDNNVTQDLDRLNKEDFIKTFEEMKQEIGAQRAKSLSVKSKTPKGTGAKQKNGRFPFSFKNWILSPRAPKNTKGGSKTDDIPAYDDNVEHSISNSDVSFAYSVGKGRGGYHVEGRITALGRYNQQKVDFIPDTPEFTPHQTPKIKGMDEFTFNGDSPALCQSPTPELEIEPMDIMRLEMEEDEKVKEKVNHEEREKEQENRRKRKEKKKKNKKASKVKKKKKKKKKKEKPVPRATYDMDGSETDSDISF